MISRNQAMEFHNIIQKTQSVGGMKGVVELKIHDKKGNLVDIQKLYEGYDIDDKMFNLSLETAKKIMAHVMAGNMDYKLAKVAFGNCGHDFDNTKKKVDPVVTDIELKAAELIKKSLNDDDIDDFTYTHDDVKHRIVYIEKNITAANISFGPSGNTFTVEMPISYDDFNLRDGAQDDEKNPFVDANVSYDYVMSDDTLGLFRNVDDDGNIKDPGTNTEVVQKQDDDDNDVYRFINGLDSDGNVDVDNGGTRPQEISEILLCANIVGSGEDDDPYEKLASSRVTSGLLVFPEGFNFTYSWTLSWNLVD